MKIISFLLGTTSIGTLHDSVYVKLLTKLEAFTSDPPAPPGDTPSRNGENVDGSRTGLIWVGSDVTARYLRGDSRCRQPRSTDRPEPGGEPGATLDRGVRHRCGRGSCSGVGQMDMDVLWGSSSTPACFYLEKQITNDLTIELFVLDAVQCRIPYIQLSSYLISSIISNPYQSPQLTASIHWKHSPLET